MRSFQSYITDWLSISFVNYSHSNIVNRNKASRYSQIGKEYITCRYCGHSKGVYRGIQFGDNRRSLACKQMSV